MDSVCAHSQEIIGRADALARGLKRYFTGKPCKRGHVAERLTSDKTCLECAAERRKSESGRARSRARTAAWRARDPEKVRTQNRARYADNPEKEKARQKRYLEANPGAATAHKKTWRRRNPEAARAIVRNRRAREIAAAGTHTKQDIAEILRAQRNRCGYCRIKLSDKYHVDHVTSLAKGGSNQRSNLQILCQPCNNRKSDKDPITFAQELGRLL